MIPLLSLLAILLTLAVSVLTACAVAVRSFTGATRAVVGEPPAGLGARSVSIPCGGHALAGWFAPGRPGGGGVILLHGLRSDRRALASRTAMLARGGSAVLALDLRAHGESGGASVTLGLREAEDAAMALDWLRAAAPGERIGGIGVSLGRRRAGAGEPDRARRRPGARIGVPRHRRRDPQPHGARRGCRGALADAALSPWSAWG